MKHALLIAIAMGGSVAFSHVAVFAQGQAAVTDPQAVVPAVVYQSVFKETPMGVETQSVDWKKANAEVAQFPRGHFDILKWEESQAKAQRAEKGQDKTMLAPGSGQAQPPQSAQSARTPAAAPAVIHKH